MVKELFAALPDDPAPPLADGYLDEVLVRGRRSVRRRRLANAGVWAVVLLALAALVIPAVPLDARPAAPARHPSLPDRFAGYSLLTSSVERSAPGRVIAIYGYGNGETFNMFQPLVVGADADTYRRVSAMEERGGALGLLSPDGTRVLVGDDRGAAGDLVLVELTSGRRRTIALGAPVGVRLLAWSPDGRYVAYSAAPIGASDGAIDFVESEVLRHGTLRLLDVASGRIAELGSLSGVSTAAFAPDGARVAVQVAAQVHLLDLNGHEDGVVALDSGRGLVAGVGWSPDGRFLATAPWSGGSGHGSFLTDPGDVQFVPVAPQATPPGAVEDVVRMLGWRDAGRIVAATVDSPGGRLSLSEIDLGSGQRRVLSRFDTGRSCELGMQQCEVYDLQLAAGLLPDLAVRHAGSPDRGPWPWILRIPAAVLLAGALLLWWRLSRPRRAAP
ncbi:MAG TPA: hypothetical protein VL738_41870 [Dactylosporangium sp.]|nr:hypothetical protein [Dactylosporangium sp.]